MVIKLSLDEALASIIRRDATSIGEAQVADFFRAGLQEFLTILASVLAMATFSSEKISPGCFSTRGLVAAARPRYVYVYRKFRLIVTTRRATKSLLSVVAPSN